MERRSTQRGDIQALRALAVVSVVVYHLWPTTLAGGFVGVDVFFVISGFLIGSHLLAELDATGRIRLGRFWARRAKRLLPASLTVLVAVLLASQYLVPLSRRTDLLTEVIGSAFYVQNWVLASRAVDYLQAEQDPSALQHFWTLSVEEQFYIILPLILLMAVLLGHRARLGAWARHHVAMTVVVGLGVISLGVSMSQSLTDPGIAYFSTATRGWEFCAGVVLAAAGTHVLRDARRGVPWRDRLPRSMVRFTSVLFVGYVRTAIGVLGLTAIVVAVVTFDAATVFPGYAAALPVAGTVALLVSGSHGPMAVLARLRPVTFVGDISYAVYLWHWPLIVLVPQATGQSLRPSDKIAIAAATIVLAWISTRLIEEPIRFSPRLLGAGRSSRLIGAWMLAASLAVSGTSAGALTMTQASKREAEDRVQQLIDDADTRCLGAAQASNSDCPDLGSVLVPDPSIVADDDFTQDGCWAGWRDPNLNLCAVGTPRPRPDGSAPLRVLAVGDSHNNAFAGAYEQIQRSYGWDMSLASHAACPWIDQASDSQDVRADACGQWRTKVSEHLRDSPPYDLIITTQQRRSVATGQRQRLVDLLAATWTAQIARGTQVIAIEDTPRARNSIVECLESQDFTNLGVCANPVANAFNGYDPLPGAVAVTAGARLVSVNDLLCGPAICPAVIGNVVVYRDPSHLSATFARTLGPFLGARITDTKPRFER